ncbi:MAG: ribosomal protein [Rhodospirillales bacterium]|nr:ribosomal protein [Rhodospirillales bacterium]
MEVILLERVPNLGQLGQIVKVKPGYARNFLLPTKKALRATKENLAYFERQKSVIEQTNADRRQGATVQGTKVDGASVVIVRQAAESGQLYGSVTARDIADAISAQGTLVDRNHIVLNQAIKTLGLFSITVALHPEVSVKVTVNIARSEEEAKTQAARGEALIGRADDEDEGEAPAAAPEATEES